MSKLDARGRVVLTAVVCRSCRGQGMMRIGTCERCKGSGIEWLDLDGATDQVDLARAHGRKINPNMEER